MKKKLLCISLAAIMCTSIALTGCGRGGNNQDVTVPTEDAADWYKTYDKVSNSGFNSDLYYLNDFRFQVADPDVIYIDHGEEKGYFYAYGTSDLIGGLGFQCWRSKDLTNWEYKSVAYTPDANNAWGYKNHWAPEVIYDPDMELYLMFYNADWGAVDPNGNWAEKGDNAKSMSVVCAEQPYGPFVPLEDKYASKPVYDFSSRNTEITDKELMRGNAIDAHPFIDDDGTKYLYYSGYGTDGFGNGRGQTLFGVKMKNNDWRTPDYSTLVQLTKLHSSSMETDGDLDEGRGRASVNEGAYVRKHNGNYYLTFSVYAFDQPEYQVRQAISTTGPLGPYTKVRVEDGGQIIYTESTWDGKITSAGHHCFIECGDELMIAYHSFYNRRNIDNGRAIAIDTVSWVKNDKGQDLMHANGPTYAYMPLPEEISGYKNVALDATVTVSNAQEGTAKYINDGSLMLHAKNDMSGIMETTGGTSVIDVKFKDYVTARSVILYNGYDYNTTFTNVKSIELYGKGEDGKTVLRTIKDVKFDFDWHTDKRRNVYPGASVIAEFADMPVNEIKITVPAGSTEKMKINEVVVLGKDEVKGNASAALTSYSFTENPTVKAVPTYESTTFGSVNDYYYSDYGFDLSHDDGTENAYIDKTWAGNMQKVYFKDVESTVLYVEVQMSTLNNDVKYNYDPYPKAGIVLTCRSKFFISFNIDYVGSQVGFVRSNSTGSDYNWNRYETFAVEGLKFTGNNYAKLAMARVDDKLYMFCNDRLVTTTTDSHLTEDRATASAVSFVTFNHFTRFKNYSCITQRADVMQKLAQLNVTVED